MLPVASGVLAVCLVFMAQGYCIQDFDKITGSIDVEFYSSLFNDISFMMSVAGTFRSYACDNLWETSFVEDANKE